MATGNGKEAVVIGMISKKAVDDHREDYVVRILQPSRGKSEPKIDLRVWVDNENSNPPFRGLTSRGGYFSMNLAQFNELVDMKPAVTEAYKAATLEEGEKPKKGAVPKAPSLELLGAGVTG